MKNPVVQIYTKSAKFLGAFDDEPWEVALNIVQTHIEAGDIVLIVDSEKDLPASIEIEGKA